MHQFIIGLDEKQKIDLVQIYPYAKKRIVSYVNAKQAVKKIY